jgi:hypothetical protein
MQRTWRASHLADQQYADWQDAGVPRAASGVKAPTGYQQRNVGPHVTPRRVNTWLGI